MLAARIKRNPARMYFAALLPLCKNLIMDGKLQENYGGQLIIYYKWVCCLTKLYPPDDRRRCRREHHIWRHNPKIQKSRMSRHQSQRLAACLRNSQAVSVLHLLFKGMQTELSELISMS